MFIRKRLGIALGLMGMLALAGTAAIAAPAPGAGLGSHWPAAQDVSRHSAFHAYRFNVDGVSFVQINGANGEPRMAVADGGGAIILLPIGDPSAVVVDPPAATLAGLAVTPVYTDEAITIGVTSAGFVVTPAAAGGCNDSVECTRPKAAPVQTMQAAGAVGCGDPVECTRAN